MVDELLDGHDFLLTTALWTNGDCSVSLLLFTDNHHIRNALQLVIANLTTQFLVTQVDGRTYPTLLKLLCYLVGIVVIFL